jgi:hypothetical protein
MPSLCSLCDKISFLDLPPYPPSLAGYHVPFKANSELFPFITKTISTPEKGKHKMPVGPLGLAHHPSLVALQDAAEGGCEVCAMIEQSVDRVRAVLEEAGKDKLYVTYDRTGPPTWEFWLSKRKEGGDGVAVWSMAEKGEQVYLVGVVGFCVDDGKISQFTFVILHVHGVFPVLRILLVLTIFAAESPLKDNLCGRIVHEDPMHPAVLNRMRNWVNDCNENHSKCHPGEVDLPFRVLDVANPGLDSNTIKLVEPAAGTNGRYVSLSHCWGKSQPFTTTKATMASRKASIDVSGLPQTFQDAIAISRELGIRYIWIDSLCICQDDGADWERESAKMASIYMNSYLTLAASRAKDDSDGFLGPRDARVHVELPVTIPRSATGADGSNDKADTETLYLFNIPLNLAASGHQYVVHMEEPLTTRAWVVQERFLTPRTLHFGSSQISFECIEIFKTEDGYQQTLSLFNITELPDMDLTDVGIDRDFSFRGSRRWNEILRIYSRKALSWESDKLPALSGLARLFEQKYGDEYVAGLWRSNIVEGICWQTYGDPHSRPKKYRAPSWSWASIDGLISITSIGSWKDLVEVVDVQTQVKGENRLGEVSGGNIVLRATLERISIREQKLGPDEDIDTGNGGFLWWFGTEDKKSEEERRHGRFDIESDMKSNLESLEMYILPLAAEFRGNDLACFALVVVPDHEGRYQRVGWIIMDEKEKVHIWKDLKEKGELKTIVLV